MSDLEHRDPRFRFLPADPGAYRCPSHQAANCHGPLIISVLKHPDGRQRALWACVEHFPLEAAAFLNSWRGSPPPDLG